MLISSYASFLSSLCSFKCREALDHVQSKMDALVGASPETSAKCLAVCAGFEVRQGLSRPAAEGGPWALGAAAAKASALRRGRPWLGQGRGGQLGGAGAEGAGGDQAGALVAIASLRRLVRSTN